MNRKYKALFLTAFLLFSKISFGSALSISVLTLEPGNNLYTLFGHTAIRITDSTNNTDRVFNFGTFNFDDRYFYFRFVRGNLQYSLSITDYDDFLAEVMTENRTIHEQVVDMTHSDKKLLHEKLNHCYHSTERYYTYDFFRNNCATKVRDYIFTADRKPVTSNLCCKTFRQLIEPYICQNYWLTIGINLTLGREADQIAKPGEYMFLPFFIQETVRKSDILSSERLLLKSDKKPEGSKRHSWYSPWIIAGGFVILYLKRKTRCFAFVLFSTAVGLTGMLLLVVSLVSQNSALSHNFNVLWTAPAMILVFLKPRLFSLVYKTGYLIFLAAILIFQNYMPQEISFAYIPWIITMILLLSMNIYNTNLETLNLSNYKPFVNG